MRVLCLIDPQPMEMLPKTNEPLYATYFWYAAGNRFRSQVQEFTSDHIRNRSNVEWEAWSYTSGFVEQTKVAT